MLIVLIGSIIFVAGCTSTGQVSSQTKSLEQSNQAQQIINQSIVQIPQQQTTQTPKISKPPSKSVCQGSAICEYGNVTRIIDGDTIDVDSVRIRLVLVDAPELTHRGGVEAAAFVLDTCPVGSQVLIDQDDWQLYDDYSRMLGVVWCEDKRLNEETIKQSYASLYSYYCSQSEFGDDAWAVNLGCTQYQPVPSQTTSTPSDKTTNKSTGNCDTAYPTVCIPSPPPDLDCSDISYRRFEVRSPDPHRFDGDRDGIGCER